MSKPPGAVAWWLMSTFLAKPGEIRAMCWSAAYHFFVLFSYSTLRPFREAVGIERGYDKLAWLMTGTMVAMLLVNPLFAAMVSRLPRRRFIPLTYHVFALTMLLFFGLFVSLPKDALIGLGYAVYIWLSVFNLFVVSVFWAFMADIFNKEQAKRLFGFIAVGGTLGALAGPLCTGWLVDGIKSGERIILQIPPHATLLISFVGVELAALCVRRVLKLAGMDRAASHSVPNTTTLRQGAEPSPTILEGLRLLARSPYLMLIAVFMLLFTVLSSLLYMEQGRIVQQTFANSASRTAAFARLDVYAQSLTLILQLLITSRVLRYLGVGFTLTLVPLITIAGFAVLLNHDTFAVIATVMVFRRAFHYALDRPAREVLYTVVGPDAKYKSKSFIDTFIYRGGDALGGWMERLTTFMGVAVGYVAIPLASIAAIVGVFLGWLQQREPWVDSATQTAAPECSDSIPNLTSRVEPTPPHEA